MRSDPYSAFCVSCVAAVIAWTTGHHVASIWTGERASNSNFSRSKKDQSQSKGHRVYERPRKGRVTKNERVTTGDGGEATAKCGPHTREGTKDGGVCSCL